MKNKIAMIVSEVSTTPRIVITAEQVSIFHAKGHATVLSKEDIKAAIKLQEALALNKPKST